jgi:hypothetical protein
MSCSDFKELQDIRHKSEQRFGANLCIQLGSGCKIAKYLAVSNPSLHLCQNLSYAILHLSYVQEHSKRCTILTNLNHCHLFYIQYEPGAN